MCIWNKILVGLIGVASLVLFYMAARALKTETYWSELAQKHEQRLRQVTQQNIELMEGTPQQPGIRQLRLETYKLLLDRRRVWWNCDPKLVKPGAEGGLAEITLELSQPDKTIPKKLVVYVFEEAFVQNKEHRGQYLGEFTITNIVNGKQLTLESTGRLSPREADKLKRARPRWALYELLPRDSHEIFASLSDAEKKAMFLPDSVQEYLKDGKPAAKDDPVERVVNGKFVRQVNDYGVLLTDERNRRVLLNDVIKATKEDKQLVEQALVEGHDQEETCKQEIAATEAELKKIQRERDIVATLHQKLQKNLDDMQAWITQLAMTNRTIAGQLAKYQIEASRRIDKRTPVMARSATGP
jgi:hypothetical protein